MMYRLLIAEDETIIRRGLTSALDWRGLGFEVAGAAEDGQEALEMFKALRPRVVLTDIKMPGMDGLELLREIHALDPEVQVVIVTGYAEFEYAREALQNQAFDYVLKMDILTALEPVMRRLRDVLDATVKVPSAVRRLPENAVFMAFARDDASGLTLPGMCARPVLALGDDDVLKRALSDIVGADGCARLEGGLWACLPGADSDGTLERKISEIARAGRVIVGGCVRSREELLERVRRVRKLYDALRLASPDALPCKGNVVREEEWTWSVAGTSGMTDAGGLTLALLNGDVDGFSRLLDESARAMVNAESATIAHARTLWITALSRATAVRPEAPAKPYADCIELLSDSTSILSAADGLKALVPELMRALAAHSPCADPAIASVVNYVGTHFSENIRMEDMARRVYMNPSYFSRLFKQEMGENFSDYLKRLRLDWAKNLLESTELRVQDVAREAGYSDMKHFTRLFRQTYGMNPSGARKN